jgi:hypothetical protein
VKKLKRTSRYTLRPDGKGGHYHIVYLNYDTGTGVTTTADGHTHEVRYSPPLPAQEAQYDEMGQEVAPAQEEQSGYFEILPDPFDGHTHEIEEYPVKIPKTKESKEDILRDVYNLFKEWSELEKSSRDKGRESDGFYSGESQWDEAQKRELDSLNRACVTINLIGRHLDELKGYQMQQRTDIKFLPIEGGDAVVADILDIVTKNILDRCFYQREKTKVFHDQIVPGRGLINIYVSFRNELTGEIIVERFPWDQVVFGPHEKEDLSDCEGLIKHRMYSLAHLTQLWGDKASEIQKDFKLFQENRDVHVQYKTDQYAHSDNRYTVAPLSINEDAIVDIAKKEYRVLECWRRKYVNVPVTVNVDDDTFINCYGWDKRDLEAIKTLDGFYVVQKPSVKIRVTKVAGNVVLSDEDPAELPSDDFHLIPVYAHKHKDRFWGKVEAAKDAQREVNYRRSQAIDIGNKMIAYGYFITDDTFSTPEEELKFKRQSTSPGGVYRLGVGQSPPTKIEGSKFPQEIVEMMNIGAADVQRLINISIDPGGANESGAMFLNKQKQKLTANEFLFDNLAFAEQKLGRLLIPLIQRYYTPERIARIVNFYAETNEVKLAGVPYDNFTEAQIIELLENADLSKYDVQISESSYSPTIRLATFQMLNDMAAKGVQISPTSIIRLAPIPEAQRNEILQDLQAMNQEAATAEAGTADTEIAKTLFAQGVYPKKYLEQYGIDPAEVPGPQEPEQNSKQLPPSIPNLQSNGIIPAEFP